jgi:hypothetical protein
MDFSLTLIKNKFNYTTIDRTTIDGQRRYLTPDGHAVASVTTILGATKDQTHLDNWRRSVGANRAYEIVTEAAGVGSRMHKYLEKYIETGVWPVAGSNPYAQQAHSMATAIKIHALGDMDEIWGSEVPLYVPQLYAGTTDLVGLYKGNPAVCDFKQSNKVKKKEWIEDYYLQIVLYGIAHNELYGTDIREGHIFMCTRDLQYLQFDVWPDEWNYWCTRAWNRVYDFYSTDCTSK